MQERHGNVKKTWQWRHVGKLWHRCHFSNLVPNLEESGSWIPNAWSIKLTVSLKTIFYFKKTENRTKNSLTQLSYYCIEYRHYFCQKMLISCKKLLISSKLRESWYENVYCLKLRMCVYLRTKFPVSNIILRCFRLGGTGW